MNKTTNRGVNLMGAGFVIIFLYKIFFWITQGYDHTPGITELCLSILSTILIWTGGVFVWVAVIDTTHEHKELVKKHEELEQIVMHLTDKLNMSDKYLE